VIIVVLTLVLMAIVAVVLWVRKKKIEKRKADSAEVTIGLNQTVKS